MTMNADLHPAAKSMAALVRRVDDDQLGSPTPCPKYTVGDLLDHIGGLTRAFTDAARKTNRGAGRAAPHASGLEAGWRARIAADLDELASAWDAPDAWTGMTAAGGVELPGAVGGLVALDELVLHGWDLARATGQPFEVDDATLRGCREVLGQFGDGRGTAFAAPVSVPADAPLLDQVVALGGRDPGWQTPLT